MNRRKFIAQTVGGGLAASGGGLIWGETQAPQVPADVKIKIIGIEPLLIRAARDYPAWTWVRIRTDQGLEGLGEGFAWTHGAPGRVKRIVRYIEQLSDPLAGTSPLQVQSFVNKAMAQRPLHKLEWGAAISAIEIAMWDLVGQVAGLPIHGLLGGAVRKRIPLYANAAVFRKGYGTPDPDEGFDVERILAMKAAGFPIFKWDPFRIGGNPGEKAIRQQVEQVARVREAVGDDYQLAIDAHQRFDLEGAKMVARALEPLNILFFEEPVGFDRPDWFKALSEATSIPLATGENSTHRKEVAPFLETGGLSYFQPEVGTNGGILESYKIAAMCEPFGIQIAPHDWCGPIVSRAAMHVSAAIPNLAYQEWAAVGPRNVEEQDLLDPPVSIEQGHLLVSDSPGLGCRLNEKLVKARRLN
jgi:L-alanine-DL-glutamate epimerase-like enolase superfamily enzyme